jgi:hypothetical protein
MERVSYAFIGSVFGALLGLLGWWLYGLAHSLNYRGPAMDPVLRHWLTWSIAASALLGLALKDKMGELVGDALAAILHFEFNLTFNRAVPTVVGIVFLAIVFAAIWHTTPHLGLAE